MTPTEFIQKGALHTNGYIFYSVWVEEDEDNYIDFKIDWVNEDIIILDSSFTFDSGIDYKIKNLIWERAKHNKPKKNDFEHPSEAADHYKGSLNYKIR